MKRFVTQQPDQLEPEDAALFRAAVGAVKPLPQQNRITPQKPPRRPFLRSPAFREPIPDTLSDGYPAKSFSDFAAEDAPAEYLGNGLSHMTLRKLRRGTWPIQDRLDLHGNNSDAARRLLQEFLHAARQQALRCVLVIHGKGMNSRGGEAVLKMRVRHWLIQHPLVLAYCDALPKDGGSGAVLLLLKAGA